MSGRPGINSVKVLYEQVAMNDTAHRGTDGTMMQENQAAHRCEENQVAHRCEENQVAHRCKET